LSYTRLAGSFRDPHGQHHLATITAPFCGTSARSIGAGSSGLPLPLPRASLRRQQESTPRLTLPVGRSFRCCAC